MSELPPGVNGTTILVGLALPRARSVAASMPAARVASSKARR